MEWSQFPNKILGLNFGNSVLNKSNWNKMSKGIIKKLISGKE